MSCGVEFFCSQFVKKHGGSKISQHLQSGVLPQETLPWVTDGTYLSRLTSLHGYFAWLYKYPAEEQALDSAFCIVHWTSLSHQKGIWRWSYFQIPNSPLFHV